MLKLVDTLSIKNAKLGFCLYAYLVLGLDKQDLLRVNIEINGSFADIITLVEIRSQRVISRIIPNQLKQMIITSKHKFNFPIK
jgi:translation elongation factor EF-4